MKKTKIIKDSASKSIKELAATLAEKRLALRNFRFSVAGSSTRNVKEGTTLKKDIARILTAISAKAK